MTSCASWRSRSAAACSPASPATTWMSPRDGTDGVTLTVTDVGLTHRMGSAIQGSIETIRRRVDAFGTTEPSIQREGRNRVLVQVPGIQDVQRLKELIGKTGKLEFKLVDPSVNAVQVAENKQVPMGDELVYGNPPSGAPPGSPQIPYVLKSQVLVSGQNLVDAQAGVRSAHRRAGGDLPLRCRRRQALRHGDAGECRAALRHRARRQGDLGAGDPRADPRRHRPDQRQLHRSRGERPRRAAPRRALCRPSSP